jgi:biopolymer transport protein ExbD
MLRRTELKHKDPHSHAIHAPGRRLLRRIPLPFVKKSAGGEKKRSVVASLNLVSFIDFLVVTVIFLLMSFSASGQCPGRDVNIPGAMNGSEMVDAPMVSVQGDQILVDGVSAGSVRSIEELGRLEKVDELFKILGAKRDLWKSVQPGRPFPGAVILQIDQNVTAIVVKSVFQTAAAAGYPNVSFMVREIRGGGAAAMSR